MARLLLWSAPMKAWALVPLLVASSGCLYLDDINEPPTVSLDDAITTTFKGSILTVQPIFSDPDDPKNEITFVVKIDSGDGQPLADCDYAIDVNSRPFTVSFFRTGIFQVTVIASDPHHARATASEMVTITDASPTFSPGATIMQTSTRDACNLNTAGDVITLQLDGSISDADAAASKPTCMPIDKLTYTWRISDSPSGTTPVLTLLDSTGCRPPTADSGPTLVVPDTSKQVCLWTDPMITGSLAMYSVVLDSSDDGGHTVVSSPAGNVPVGVDQPPCITGSEPVAGSYVVDRSVLQEFKIDGVNDDRDLFGTKGISYAWSVWRENDPVWRAVPTWALSTYSLDVSSFGVGEKVRVRAEALDRTGARVPAASCSPDADDCVVQSCASAPDVCHKWKTWDLELR